MFKRLLFLALSLTVLVAGLAIYFTATAPQPVPVEMIELAPDLAPGAAPRSLAAPQSAAPPAIDANTLAMIGLATSVAGALASFFSLAQTLVVLRTNR